MVMSATQTDDPTGGRVEVEWQWADYQAHTRDALESGSHDLVVLRSGYGAGKSITGAQWIHRGALQDQEGSGVSLVMGQDFQKARATTFEVYFQTLPGEDTVPDDDAGDPENSPIVAGYNQNANRVTYITGHVARLGSADKWNRYAGAEFNRIWCDEVAHYTNTDLYRLHEMLVTRQRTDTGPNTTLWTSTGNGYNEFYDITERRVDKDDEPLPWRDQIKVITASTEDNPFLPSGALSKIQRQFSGTEREKQALHGGFAAAEGLVYDSFTRNIHVVDADSLELMEDWRIYGYDYGHSDPRVLLEIARTTADQYVVVDSYYETRQPVEALIDPRDESGWAWSKPRGRVYCDHDPEHIQKFRDAGYDAVKAEKSIEEGIDEVRSVLQLDDGMEEPGLYVDESCVELIQEFQSYKEDDVATSRADDHALDSLRYAVMGDRYTTTASVTRNRGGASPSKTSLIDR